MFARYKNLLQENVGIEAIITCVFPGQIPQLQASSKIYC